MIISNGILLLIAMASIITAIKCVKIKEFYGLIYFAILAIIIICQFIYNINL